MRFSKRMIEITDASSGMYCNRIHSSPWVLTSTKHGDLSAYQDARLSSSMFELHRVPCNREEDCTLTVASTTSVSEREQSVETQTLTNDDFDGSDGMGLCRYKLLNEILTRFDAGSVRHEKLDL